VPHFLKQSFALRLIVVAVLYALPQIVWASSLDRFAEFIATTLTATGEFEQKVFDRNKKLVQESRGSLSLSRPGRFRWSYVKPYPQLIVGDGSRVWIYDEDLNQVTVKKLDQALGSTPAALLAGNNEAVKAFKLSDRGVRDGLEWLDAVPRDRDSSFSRISLGFGFSGLDSMELVDGFGQITLLRFSTFRRNAPIDASTYRFSPPKGADVIGETK
jgi:outer membrane lipoprotein carrier protein